MASEPSEQQNDRESGNGASLHRANAQQARIARLERFRSGDSSVIGVKVHKMCCVCGAMLNHKPRFKDHEGRYWCPTCNEVDHEKVRPVVCADCGIEMTRMDMREISNLLLCPVCVTKCLRESQGVTEVRLKGLSNSANVNKTAIKVKNSRNTGAGMIVFFIILIALSALLLWLFL